MLLDSFLFLSPVFILIPIVCPLNYSFVVTRISKVKNASLKKVQIHLSVFPAESKVFGRILLQPTRLPMFLGLFIFNLKFVLQL